MDTVAGEVDVDFTGLIRSSRHASPIVLAQFRFLRNRFPSLIARAMDHLSGTANVARGRVSESLDHVFNDVAVDPSTIAMADDEFWIDAISTIDSTYFGWLGKDVERESAIELAERLSGIDPLLPVLID
jgi:hypothetical protein